MQVRLTDRDPHAVDASLTAVAAGSSALGLGAPERAISDADPVALAYTAAGVLAVVAVEPDLDGLRTAAAQAVRACRGGGTVAWAFDSSLQLPAADQVRALTEGALLGAYDSRRWAKAVTPEPVEEFVICGVEPRGELVAATDRAALRARWTNTARELVDAPANLMSPEGLAERALAIPGLSAEVLDPDAAGLPALAAVGGSSPVRPRMIVLRHEPKGAPDAPRLALVGKGVTFDSGGYFLKPQHDIIRQKADMGGGAAVLGALGAIAELGLGLSVTGVVPACENMLSGAAIKPTDVIDTAAGLRVEVVNPDAEGRLILADALWYARQHGATHLVDLATLSGALRAGMGDMYGGVFAEDAEWRDQVVAAGNAAGDLAWPWPMHKRYQRLLESRVADLRNIAGRGFGFPIVAATFLSRFAGGLPWAHVDMLAPALLEEDRGDVFGAGATGYGVRMLVELAERLSADAAR